VKADDAHPCNTRRGRLPFTKKKASNKVTSSHQRTGMEQSQRQNGGNRLQLETQLPDLLFNLVQTQKVVEPWLSEVPKWSNNKQLQLTNFSIGRHNDREALPMHVWPSCWQGGTRHLTMFWAPSDRQMPAHAIVQPSGGADHLRPKMRASNKVT
jgi:hypothetical protein